MKIACCLPTYFKSTQKSVFQYFFFVFVSIARRQAYTNLNLLTYLPLLYIERYASIYCSMTTIVEHSIAQLTKVYFNQRKLYVQALP